MYCKLGKDISNLNIITRDIKPVMFRHITHYIPGVAEDHFLFWHVNKLFVRALKKITQLSRYRLHLRTSEQCFIYSIVLKGMTIS